MIAYQGGKKRLASTILQIIQPPHGELFHDLCCGSGAISLELVRHGFDPSLVVMVDKGPWGLVWEAIGGGWFDLDVFRHWCEQVPKNPEHVAAFMRELAATPVDVGQVYVFLLLQAASFGSKALWTEDGQWQNCSFRDYWKPTPTSRRRSPVNPMMPMPATLYQRVAEACEIMRGCQGICGDVATHQPQEGTVYIDPPYEGTTRYGAAFDVIDYSRQVAPCYVSEAKPLTDAAWQLSAGRGKGGISGARKRANEEWLSLFKTGALAL
jgi:site-specific DNA-adenine methylase